MHANAAHPLPTPNGPAVGAPMPIERVSGTRSPGMPFGAAPAHARSDVLNVRVQALSPAGARVLVKSLEGDRRTLGAHRAPVAGRDVVRTHVEDVSGGAAPAELAEDPVNALREARSAVRSSERTHLL